MAAVGVALAAGTVISTATPSAPATEPATVAGAGAGAGVSALAWAGVAGLHLWTSFTSGSELEHASRDNVRLWQGLLQPTMQLLLGK